MRYFVCWFLARPEDAAAIRSTATTQERQRSEWPHLVLPGVDGFDVNELEKLARPKRGKGTSRIGGKMLDRSKMDATPFTVVAQVTPEFVQTLAVLDDVAATEMGAKWSSLIKGVSPDEARQILVQMAALARQAITAGLPILELALM
jgi:hypothetical protein